MIPIVIRTIQVLIELECHFCAATANTSWVLAIISTVTHMNIGKQLDIPTLCPQLDQRRKEVVLQYQVRLLVYR